MYEICVVVCNIAYDGSYSYDSTLAALPEAITSGLGDSLDEKRRCIWCQRASNKTLPSLPRYNSHRARLRPCSSGPSVVDLSLSMMIST